MSEGVSVTAIAPVTVVGLLVGVGVNGATPRYWAEMYPCRPSQTTGCQPPDAGPVS
ncbi:MAG: hypothetical protein QM589_02350 [Thermomicrobiales bacterium]